VIRWLVDRRNSKLPQYAGLDADGMQAAGDRSAGTLLASGYIAGGALAGIIIAITAGVLTGFDTMMTKWAESVNPFFAGINADVLSLLPYAAICVLLYWVGRERAQR
jgi:LDH2 family malate/lactate/ureidoglycolate dehydrogenase